MSTPLSKLFHDQPTFIMPVRGGLGNQLFHITSGIALHSEYPSIFHNNYDISWYTAKSRQSHEVLDSKLFHPFEKISLIDKPLPESKRSWFSFINKKIKKSWEGLLDKDIFISLQVIGRIFSDKVFLNDVMLDGDYVFKAPVIDYLSKLRSIVGLNTASMEWLNALGDRSFCAIHIRRGDYLTCASFLPSLNYYLNAMRFIKRAFPDLLYVIHSDDIEWCKAQQHFQRDDVIFLDNDLAADPLRELFLLSNASAYITANSTYSWWASAFARIFNPEYKFTIMPYQWFEGADVRLTKALIRTDSVCLKSW